MRNTFCLYQVRRALSSVVGSTQLRMYMHVVLYRVLRTWSLYHLRQGGSSVLMRQKQNSFWTLAAFNAAHCVLREQSVKMGSHGDNLHRQCLGLRQSASCNRVFETQRSEPPLPCKMRAQRMHSNANAGVSMIVPVDMC